MVNRHAALFHHLFKVPVAQRLGHIPSDADHDDIDRETHSFEVEHDRASTVLGVKVYTIPMTAPLMRQSRRAVLLWSWFHLIRLPDLRALRWSGLIYATKPLSTVRTREEICYTFLP